MENPLICILLLEIIVQFDNEEILTLDLFTGAKILYYHIIKRLVYISCIQFK